MKREYVKGNKKHWREIYKYVYGIAPKTGMAMGNCGYDKAIFIKNSMGEFILYTNSAVYDAITTNPNWHEVKPWENNWKPKPFDKVLVRDSCSYPWRCAFYSHTIKNRITLKYVADNSVYEYCIPYNEYTKHLVGMDEEAPEYYRYWED